jgi:hypothetical protein
VAERASSVFDVRHRLVTAHIWELPFGKGLTGPQSLLLHGWELGGIVTMQSGLPFNITQSGDSENVDGLWCLARPLMSPIRRGRLV